MNNSIGKAIASGAETLTAHRVDSARLDASLLMAHVLGRDRTFLIAHATDSVSSAHLERFQSLVSRRAAGEPLAYITGHQEFFKLDFEVTPDVLIPRPETELIVEIALKFLKDDPEQFIADIGAGSGCIAISLLHELPGARAIATDISSGALRVTRRNADRHGVTDRLTVIESDCFSKLDAGRSFSLIAANPPYIRDDDLKILQREVGYEPRTALAAGPDGLDIIRRLLREAAPFLRTGGHFIFEIGFDQSAMTDQLIDRDVWELLGMRKDLQGFPRAVILKRI